jgi:hypothetical protein
MLRILLDLEIQLSHILVIHVTLMLSQNGYTVLHADIDEAAHK